ncbi:MAG: phosphatase PAP2 family protein [Candidatus Atelocyanobacterium thalassa]
MKFKKHLLNKIDKTFALFFITVVTLFAGLTRIVISGKLNTMDLNLIKLVHLYQHPILTKIAKIFYFLGESEVAACIVILSLGFLCWKSYWKEAQVLAISAMGILLVIDKILKPWFGRIRPIPGLIDVHGKSYPSGHISGNLMLYLYFSYLMGFYFPKWKAFFYTISIFFVMTIGWSSIYLNIHWYTDLLAGTVIAFMGFLFCITLLKSINNKYLDS